jgi:hypothetical protein
MRTMVLSFFSLCLLGLVCGCGGSSNKVEVPKNAAPPPPKGAAQATGAGANVATPPAPHTLPPRPKRP